MTSTDPDTVEVSRARYEYLNTTVANMRRSLLDQEVMICHQAAELRTLNDVIYRRKRQTRRLQGYIKAIKDVHAPTDNNGLTVCAECRTEWPCKTLMAGHNQGTCQ